MLRIDPNAVDRLETTYPGIGETIFYFEEATYPACPCCCSQDTASLQCGIIGRTINIAGATTKLKLIANGPRPGQYFCNSCNEFFG